MVRSGSQVVPYFSSSENTQFIILNEELSELTVWELEESNGNFMSRRIKVFKPDAEFRGIRYFHSALITEKNEALILFDS